ncbi:uncharacterized protein PHACADRAFT_108868, partial [Phanerochaete carnosa HHB-10118-sp]
GPCLLGIFLNVLLYGVVLVQAQMYYVRYPGNVLFLLLTSPWVSLLILADSLNTAFNIAWIYMALINNFGNFDILTRANWCEYAVKIYSRGVIATMAQLFYARRIWILIKNCWLIGLIVSTSCVSGLAAIGCTVVVIMRPLFSNLHSSLFMGFGLPWLVSCTICDISIATALSVYLSKQKTGFKRTNSAVTRIIRSTVSNGLLTASFTIGHMVLWLSTPLGIHYIFNYGVVKLYTNSVISSLNSRHDLAARMSAELSEAVINVNVDDVRRSYCRPLHDPDEGLLRHSFTLPAYLRSLPNVCMYVKENRTATKC